MDPVIEDQASLADIDDVTPGTTPAHPPWQEPEQILPEEEGKVWAGGEVTGIAGGGMPEAAGQARHCPRPRLAFYGPDDADVLGGESRLDAAV